MTFNEMVKNYLINNGRFVSQADKILNILHDEEQDMKNRWNDPIEDYPVVMQSILIFIARRTASKWIAENIPNAWFRPMFEEKDRGAK